MAPPSTRWPATSGPAIKVVAAGSRMFSVQYANGMWLMHNSVELEFSGTRIPPLL